MSGAKIFAPVAAVCLFLGAAPALAQTDPGVQGGAARAGAPVPGLTANERIFFDAGLEDFEEAEGVGDGLGPRFNLDGCGGCHSQPAIGGTSPAVNPQFAIATAFGARNTVPSFITLNGPIREARFKRLPNGQPDGGVHALYVISHNDSGKLHPASETGTDGAYAERTRGKAYRTTPLRGLWQHPPYFHDGSAKGLHDVVDHYNDLRRLELTSMQRKDLVEYLKTL